MNFNCNDILDRILRFIITTNCTWNTASEVVAIVNATLGEKIFPESKFQLLKLFARDTIATYHLTCAFCKEYGIQYRLNSTDKLKCSKCNRESPKITTHNNVLFVTFSIREIIEKLIKEHEQCLIVHNNVENAFPMTDVFCGQVFRDCFARNGPHLAIGVNTDGVKKFKATKESLWPLFVCLYNLPKDIRLKQHNIGIVALFNGRNINMEDFVSSFIKEISEINSTGGIEVKNKRLKVFCLTASLDSVARPKLQNHKQFNGFWGCTYCFTKGKRMENRSLKFPLR